MVSKGNFLCPDSREQGALQDCEGIFLPYFIMFFKLRYTGILFKKLIYLFLAVLHKRHVEFKLVPPAVGARSLFREAPGILDCTISKGLFFFSHLVRQKSTSLL